ncbi:MAG: glycosyl hydrolase family 5, partial [Candidatus Eremiobacteraeota bacterium]|nr:glycosyl hydrolase family 5 [Candidatus Eremiobacteraeota bacterium]
LMTRSSGTCDVHGPADRRNCMGYAIAEIGAGLLERGVLRDVILHAPCGGEKPGVYHCGRRQSATYVSSVDPWHAAADRVRNQEQPGLDLIARSGLTRGLPAMYPVPMLYSTPENAVAEVRYLAARGYPLQSVELGEEPDGQYTTPEDYGALYLQWATALHAAFPHLQLGGPVFSGVNSELQAWPDAHDNISWMNRFLAYLQAHSAMDQLAFVSFEHYPFGGCEHGEALQRDLLREPSIMRGIVNTWHADGVPLELPLYVTEANFSAVNFTQVPMQIEGALWQAEYMASALAAGVRAVVYYQYEPVPLSRNRDCPGDWGNLTMFVAHRGGRIRARAAQFFAGEMLMQHWLVPGDAPHVLHPASSNVTREDLPLISAYAVERPDKTWSIMLINKDARAHDVRVQFVDPDLGAATGFAGKVTRVTFGSAQYTWHRRGAASRPDPAAEPVTSQLDAIYQGPFTIPAQSITVLRGALGLPGAQRQ